MNQSPPKSTDLSSIQGDFKKMRDCPVEKQLLGGTGRAATSSARVGAGATKTRHNIPSPDAAPGDGVFAARKPPPLFVNRTIPKNLRYWHTATTAQADTDGRGWEMTHAQGAEVAKLRGTGREGIRSAVDSPGGLGPDFAP